jgi:EmrB/QacA subfamily drug resistance transporter
MIRKWLGCAALIAGVAMSFLEQTILPVALPAIQGEFGASDVELEWCVNSYMLAIAVLVLTGGKLADRIGHRNGFFWGVALFTLASIFCGMSQSAPSLIAARALQGAGGALMFPSLSAILPALFSPQERGKAMGINTSASSLFLILGPLVGGYLTEHFSWRWIFWVNIPIAGAAIALGILFLPRIEKRAAKIDPWGFLCYAFSCGALTILLMEGRGWGWSSSRSIGAFGVFAVAAFLLFLREKKAAHPYLDLGLFKHPVYRAANITVWAIQFILMVAVFRTIYFQTALGYSPVETGLFTTFCTLPVLFLGVIGGLLSDRFGPKCPIAIGFLCLIFSFFWFFFTPAPSLWQIIVPLVAFGAGVPLVFTPSYSAAIGAVSQAKIGAAFGILSATRSLGATMGVAVIGLLIDAIEKGDVNSPEAQARGFSISHLVLAFLLIAAFAAVFVLHSRKSAHRLPKTPAEGWD